MNQEQQLIELFLFMEKLIDTPRQGWYDKNIQRKRVESVADHIYGTQMLAYAMYSEFNYENVKIDRVILMLAIHEIGEIIIGDMTPEDKRIKDKRELEHQAVEEILKIIPNSDLIRELFYEFEEGKTEDAKFAYQIDKAECDLKAKIYDQEGCFKHIKDFIESWIGFDKKRIQFDDNFNSLLEYIMNNDMTVKEHTNNPIENVISFYMRTNILKDTQREGEKIWNIQKKHYGSIAEHIYSTEMMALLIHLVYNVDVDIKEVINLLSTHELGECTFGDKNAVEKTEIDRLKEYKEALTTATILKNTKMLIDRVNIFNKGETKEAKFADICDKVVPGVKSKIVDQNGLVDLKHQENNPLLKKEGSFVKKQYDNGESFSKIWISYGQKHYNLTYPFDQILNYALNNELIEPYTKIIKDKLAKAASGAKGKKLIQA